MKLRSTMHSALCCTVHAIHTIMQNSVLDPAMCRCFVLAHPSFGGVWHRAQLSLLFSSGQIKVVHDVLDHACPPFVYPVILYLRSRTQHEHLHQAYCTVVFCNVQ